MERLGEDDWQVAEDCTTRTRSDDDAHHNRRRELYCFCHMTTQSITEGDSVTAYQFTAETRARAPVHSIPELERNSVTAYQFTAYQSSSTGAAGPGKAVPDGSGRARGLGRGEPAAR